MGRAALITSALFTAGRIFPTSAVRFKANGKTPAIALAGDSWLALQRQEASPTRRWIPPASAIRWAQESICLNSRLGSPAHTLCCGAAVLRCCDVEGPFRLHALRFASAKTLRPGIVAERLSSRGTPPGVFLLFVHISRRTSESHTRALHKALG